MRHSGLEDVVLHVGVAGDALDQRVVAVAERLLELLAVLARQPEGVDERALVGGGPQRDREVAQAEPRERVAEERDALGVGLGRVQPQQLHARPAGTRRPGPAAAPRGGCTGPRS